MSKGMKCSLPICKPDCPVQANYYDKVAERIAHEFHARYEQLAPIYGYKTRAESAVPWEEVPEANRRLMVATVRSLLDRGVIRRGRWFG